jgi:O-antigen/teichoic acid export membrane protein
MSLVLSRLLSPKEIGIFSITAVLIGFTHVFRDFGVSSYIKSQKVLTDEVLRASIGVLFTSSWIIAVILYFSAEYWARFFNQPGISQIMHVQAVGFALIPFGSISQAVLARNMDIKNTTIVSSISVLVYGTACIVLAYLGFSYMSMAWANLLNIIISGIGYSILSPKNLPRLPSFKGWRNVAHFGIGAMLSSTLRAIDNALPDIILGKISGPHDVGIYSRGNSTVNIFNSLTSPTVNYFALPYLAKTHHGGEDVGAHVARSVAYLSGILWPAMIVMAVLSKEVIAILYGSAWLESATIVPWLCVCAAIQVSFMVLPQALIALNKPYLSALPLSLVVTMKIIISLATFDGQNLASFARAIAIAELSAVPIYLFLLDRHVGLKVGDWFRSIIGSLKLCGFVLLQVLILKASINSIEQPLARILLAAIWITPGWLAAVFLFKHPLSNEMLTGWGFVRSRLNNMAVKRRR